VDVFGVSWGGALAQQFAHDYQGRCTSLTLAATSAGMVMVPGKLSVLRKMATPKRYQDPEHMLKIGAEIYGGGVGMSQELLKEHAAAMRAGDKKGYLYQLMAGIGWTSFFWLGQIKVPTLILMGEKDPIVPMVNGKIMASRMPNARVETVPCGHMFVLTQAEIVADRIEAFIHEGAYAGA
jgi:poly(3-hydroxyalkanoate) depolymerase